MELDNITVALRPRSVWEAIDLGFGMTRRWWGALLKSWMLLALPAFVVFSAVFYQYPIVASLLFWWFKPAYEQLPLVYLSRSLFQQTLSFRELRRALPKIATRQIIANVTWRRLSPIRSFTAPIAQLEQLSGQQRQERLQVLENGYTGSGWLTVVGLHLEGILYFSIVLLVWFVLPEQFELEVWFDKHRTLVEIGGNIAYFIAAAIIAPFYVSSGFSLYLNRRAQLEGWDIELEFRQMQQRLHKRHQGPQAGMSNGPDKRRTSAAAGVACLLPVVLTIVFALGSPVADAAEEPAVIEKPAVVEPTKAKQLIDEVLADEDFGKKETVTRWKFKGDLEPKDTDPQEINLDFLRLFAQIGEYLLWLLVAVLVILVLYNLPRWKIALNKPSLRKPRSEPAPQVLFGLDITEESLPDDIAQEAWRLFQSKEVRRALSLLYRGSLAVLVNRHGVALKESNTEGECAVQVSQSQPATVAGYFAELTNVWIQVAYGHQLPSQERVQNLCNNWPVHFGEARQ